MTFQQRLPVRVTAVLDQASEMLLAAGHTDMDVEVRHWPSGVLCSCTILCRLIYVRVGWVMCTLALSYVYKSLTKTSFMWTLV